MGIAIILSFFIYSSYFGYKCVILNTVFGLFGIYFLLISDKKTVTWSGFFIGILWFYWIGLSFKYYNLSYLAPFVVFSIAIVYGLFFWILSYSSNPFIRSILLLGASYVHPFEFSWFKPELVFVNSYIGIFKWQFAIVLFSISLIIYLQKNSNKRFYSLLPIFLIFFSLSNPNIPKKKLPFSIYLYNQKLPQNLKWNPRYRSTIIKKNFQAIDRAIKEKKDIVILNETAFPLYLNKNQVILQRLKNLSKKIVIVTGALRLVGNSFYNSAYYFIKGKLTIANKVVLVPFGEKIPLPNFMAKIINKIFFDGASDFKTAKKPTVLKIMGKEITNAICYETTENIMYKHHTPYIIAISNNAWFTPSIEPTLQNELIKFYAKKYHTTIIHAANMGISGVF